MNRSSLRLRGGFFFERKHIALQAPDGVIGLRLCAGPKVLIRIIEKSVRTG